MKFFKLLSISCFLFFALSSTAKPIAALPPVTGYKTQKPLIYLDPGHGGLDLGAIIKSPHVEEKSLNLVTAHYIKRYLEQKGYRVSMTRSRDFFVPLDKRVNLANTARAGIFVSIHYNSSPNSTANGIEIFYSEDSNKRSIVSKKLAESVLQKTALRTEAKSRGVKKGNLFVLKQTKMPSVLVEAGFLTNPEERDKIKQRDYLDKIAKGIAEGIDKFAKGGR
jgi:N-acetylmuramoyl-L-alanine amidase